MRITTLKVLIKDSKTTDGSFVLASIDLFFVGRPILCPLSIFIIFFCAGSRNSRCKVRRTISDRCPSIDRHVLCRFGQIDWWTTNRIWITLNNYRLSVNKRRPDGRRHAGDFFINKLMKWPRGYYWLFSLRQNVTFSLHFTAGVL